jgi:hypothetical protein
MNSRQLWPGRAKTTDVPPSVRENNLVPEDEAPGFWTRLRKEGEKLTGGGLRALGRRLVLQFLRRLMWMVMRRPRLMALTHRFLRSFPQLTGRLNRLATTVDPLAGRPYNPAQRLSEFVDLTTMTLPESARIIYLRLRAIASDNDSRNRFE